MIRLQTAPTYPHMATGPQRRLQTVCSLSVHAELSTPLRGLAATESDIKPTKTTRLRTLPNGKPDQSNVVFSDDANRWVMAAIARNLSAFAKR